MLTGKPSVCGLGTARSRHSENVTRTLSCSSFLLHLQAGVTLRGNALSFLMTPDIWGMKPISSDGPLRPSVHPDLGQGNAVPGLTRLGHVPAMESTLE